MWISVFSVLSGGGGFVSTSVVCSLLAAGHAFYFSGYLRLVEACCGELVGTWKGWFCFVDGAIDFECSAMIGRMML